MRQEVWDTFPDKAGESTLMSISGGEKGLRLSYPGKLSVLSSGNRDLGVEFKVHPGSQSLFPVEAKTSALLSSCDG